MQSWRQFEKACQETGFDYLRGIHDFCNNVARERRIPFEVAVDPFYSNGILLGLRNP
jgi:DNA-damage-inducible protein J